ncbi:D-2-hydroxyacid dehydrogenase [Termitidicoccus mucosus]|uniref:D-isomer specific 2-hydroxyacid dehydrogenase NAD-binding domain-containing protein n=1 Tax=Termitidicoccus mucosus TaxID=1184151 RepID=A0A178ICF9_9BACT|nr:hypothetical protein AW736_20810 [Opitutaceae bacterium TSB47]
MRPLVLLSADQLGETHAQQIAVACSGWADFRRIPQDLPDAELVPLLARAKILAGWTPPALLPGSALEAYLCGSAGYDAYIGLGLDRKPGFRLANAAAIMAPVIAEHCLALMFALARQLPAILDQQRRRHYERRWHAGEVTGSTACIVGLGGSGTELAWRCRALGLRTIGVCRTPANHGGVTDALLPMDGLPSAVALADHIFVLLPGGAATRRVFGETIFARARRGACFYTASRGSVTDEAALVRALAGGRVAGAGVDVFEREPLPAESPLWTLPNVIVSPHSAGLSTKLNDRLAALFSENLLRLRDGRALKNQIPPAQLA